MMRTAAISALLFAGALQGAPQPARAQTAPPQSAQTVQPSAPLSAEPQSIDGIAVRIGTDVITESELRELANFQQLVDGQQKPRDEVIRELEDQWIARGEAETASYPEPTTQDVDRSYALLAKQFSVPDELTRRAAALGLTEDALRRQLSLQLFLSRFLDYRFRPEVNVDDDAIQKYYDEEFVPQLKKRDEAVPALDQVRDTIREVLVQRALNERARQWLDETRGSLDIDVLPSGSAS